MKYGETGANLEGFLLTDVLPEILQQNEYYVIEYTYPPPKRIFSLSANSWHILRTEKISAGELSLLVAARMKRED